MPDTIQFRIIHISDLHFCIRPNRRNVLTVFQSDLFSTLSHLAAGDLGTYPSSYSDEVAEGAARFVFKMRRAFDIAVISGDLATIGQRESLLAARTFIDGPAAKQWLTRDDRATLKAGTASVFLIPGNHDRFKNIMGSPGANQFDKVFAAHWRDNKVGVHHAVLEKRERRFVIIGADFCLRSGAGGPKFPLNLSQGKAYEDIVESLKSETNRLRREYGTPAVVWVVHFPPWPDCPDQYRLLQSDLVDEAAKELGVSLILAGHLHINEVYRTSNGTPVLCAGSLTSCEETGNQWLHILDLGVGEDGVSECIKHDYAWDESAGDFVSDKRSEIKLTKYDSSNSEGFSSRDVLFKM